MHGCKNQPRPTAETSYPTQHGWDYQTAPDGTITRTPIIKMTKHAMTCPCQFTITTVQFPITAAHAACDGCEHQQGAIQMTRSATDVIIKEISEHLGIPPELVKPESTLAQLGADSLDMVELTMIIEDELEIDVEALDGFTADCTVKDFTAAILAIYAAKTAA